MNGSPRAALDGDPALRRFADAFDPVTASPQLLPALPFDATLLRADVVRHVPGRRCLVRYVVATDRGERAIAAKIRVKGTDHRTLRVVSALRRRGLDGTSTWGVSVPEPLGVIEAWRMTLQAWSPGVSATVQLERDAAPGRRMVARRLADALLALHASRVPAERNHGMADELEVLSTALHRVAGESPSWRERLERVDLACRALAARCAANPATGVHRDFYPDQALVHGPHVTLLDLDLYAIGDPAVDVGNVNAHLVEVALRRWADPSALDDAVAALTDRYLRSARGVAASTIDAYTTLSLARHVAISRRIPARRHLTERVLACVEERLGFERRSTQHPRDGSGSAQTRHATPTPSDR